jgi:hypothetical protein
MKQKILAGGFIKELNSNACFTWIYSIN